jgi:hypothetical protein
MEENAHDQSPKTNPNKEDVQCHGNSSPKRQKRPLVRRYLLLTFLAGLSWVLSQYVESFDHRFLLPSLGILLLSFVLGAGSLRLVLKNHHATDLNAGGWALVVAMFGLVLCGFLYWWDRDQASKPAESPTITFNVGPTLNPKNPFETRFLLKNIGSLPIYAVECTGFLPTNLNTNPIAMVAIMSLDSPSELAPNAEKSIYFRLPPIPGLARDKILFQVRTWYHYRLVKRDQVKSQVFQFYTIKGPTGDFQWFPAGSKEWDWHNPPGFY